jgi:hypothetical protein
MGVRTNRETSLQLGFIWDMIDAAIYPLKKGLEQHGYKFQIMPAARRRRKEREKFRFSAASEEFIGFKTWAWKISVVISHQCACSV